MADTTSTAQERMRAGGDVVFREPPDGAPTDAGEAPNAAGLYPGDTGLLPEVARRALVQLLSGPSLEQRRHPRLWPVLLQHETVIRSRLADLFLELILDPDRGIAFSRQADTGELETPILLRRSPLTFIDSVLLLYLRQVLVEAELRGQPALVDRDELAEQLRLYESADNTDRAGFEKRINNAIEKAKKNSLLSALKGNADRFEVSASLKLIFGPEEVEQLTAIYSAMAAEPGREDAQ
ncbi:MAG: DUF4194 domain-containing protein [Thiohalocapsa sp.]|jgi:hypothetical protein|uniref:DUF4194 domain-containing protein n=1 Tax=Thiohalocapsa sp. TaxID=2497641 RepID=UPI0025CCA8FB|nr:DUF4194 domain-containing protein [Thiohalocapsa sp.]MCG6940866.1 DUF4194 domain-containing protein [Thiohalocapsa sp.]